jgi:hypothetical protein
MAPVLCRLYSNGTVTKTLIAHCDTPGESFFMLFKKMEPSASFALNNVEVYGHDVSGIRKKIDVNASQSVTATCFNKDIFPGGQPQIEFHCSANMTTNITNINTYTNAALAQTSPPINNNINNMPRTNSGLLYSSSSGSSAGDSIHTLKNNVRFASDEIQNDNVSSSNNQIAAANRLSLMNTIAAKNNSNSKCHVNINVAVTSSTTSRQIKLSDQRPRLTFKFGTKPYICEASYFIGSYTMYQSFISRANKNSNYSSYSSANMNQNNVDTNTNYNPNPITIEWDRKMSNELYETDCPPLEDNVLGLQSPSSHSCVFTTKPCSFTESIINGTYGVNNSEDNVSSGNSSSSSFHSSINVHLDSCGLQCIFTLPPSNTNANTNANTNDYEKVRGILFRRSSYLIDDLLRFVKRYDKTIQKNNKIDIIDSKNLFFVILFRTPNPVKVNAILNQTNDNDDGGVGGKPLPNFDPTFEEIYQHKPQSAGSTGQGEGHGQQHRSNASPQMKVPRPPDMVVPVPPTSTNIGSTPSVSVPPPPPVVTAQVPPIPPPPVCANQPGPDRQISQSLMVMSNIISNSRAKPIHTHSHTNNYNGNGNSNGNTNSRNHVEQSISSTEFAYLFREKASNDSYIIDKYLKENNMGITSLILLYPECKIWRDGTKKPFLLTTRDPFSIIDPQEQSQSEGRYDPYRSRNNNNKNNNNNNDDNLTISNIRQREWLIEEQRYNNEMFQYNSRYYPHLNQNQNQNQNDNSMSRKRSERSTSPSQNQNSSYDYDYDSNLKRAKHVHDQVPSPPPLAADHGWNQGQGQGQPSNINYNNNYYDNGNGNGNSRDYPSAFLQQQHQQHQQQQQQQQQQQSLEPCPFYKNHLCLWGIKCKYSHPLMTKPKGWLVSSGNGGSSSNKPTKKSVMLSMFKLVEYIIENGQIDNTIILPRRPTSINSNNSNNNDTNTNTNTNITTTTTIYILPFEDGYRNFANNKNIHTSKYHNILNSYLYYNTDKYDNIGKLITNNDFHTTSYELSLTSPRLCDHKLIKKSQLKSMLILNLDNVSWDKEKEKEKEKEKKKTLDKDKDIEKTDDSSSNSGGSSKVTNMNKNDADSDVDAALKGELERGGINDNEELIFDYNKEETEDSKEELMELLRPIFENQDENQEVK